MIYWEIDQENRLFRENMGGGKGVGLEEQGEGRLLVEELLSSYNDGRSMSFYCLSCTLMPTNLVNEALAEIKTMPLEIPM